MRSPIGLRFLIATTIVPILLGISCGSGGLSNAPVDASAECFTDSDCFAAQHCVEGLCICDPTTCNGHCSTTDVGQCLASGCTLDAGINRCGQPGFDMCDPVANQCYPSIGSCKTDSDCPTFGGAAASWGVASCGPDGFCHMASPPPSTLADLDTASLSVGGIPAGDWFQDQAAIRFTWAARGGPVVVSVSESAVQTSMDLANPFWAAFVGSSVTSAVWATGATWADNQWVTPPANAPHDTPLYAVVAAYDGAQLAAASDILRFRVGSPWPGVGAGCTASSGLSGCDSPVSPLVCEQATCRLLCASNVDCAHQPGQRCELPDPSGIRVCALPAPQEDAGTAE